MHNEMIILYNESGRMIGAEVVTYFMLLYRHSLERSKTKMNKPQ